MKNSVYPFGKCQRAKMKVSRAQLSFITSIEERYITFYDVARELIYIMRSNESYQKVSLLCDLMKYDKLFLDNIYENDNKNYSKCFQNDILI